MARFVGAEAADNLFLTGFEIVFDPGVILSGAAPDHFTMTLGGTSIAFGGTNLTYAGGAVNGGTITSYTVSVPGVTGYTASELSIAASDFASAPDIEHLRDLVAQEFAGNDIIIGSATDDRLSGLSGKDKIRGGDGIDFLGGDLGRDTMKGGAGDDFLSPGPGKDKVNGGPGVDVLGLENADPAGSIAVTLNGAHWATTEINGRIEDKFKNIENLAGNAAHIKFIGDGQANHFQPIGNDNILKGLGGDDFMILYNGLNRVHGGSGRDTFNIQAEVDGNNLTKFKDFETGVDTIRLGEFFNALPFGRVDPSHFVVGTDAVDADDFLIHDETTGKLFYDHDGAGGDGKILFAKVVTPGLHLASTDFDVIF